VVGAVFGSSFSKFFQDAANIQNDDWGYGVFYGTDGNSVDQRCRWVEEYKGYDCPGGWQPWAGTFVADPSKKGSGNYQPGSPHANLGGGGAGCHFSVWDKGIDQFDSPEPNLVGNQWCECNYKLKGNQWQDWVKQWIYHGRAKDGFEWMGWFGKGKAPAFGVDLASCWVNNPRDMIQIQNAMWFLNDEWNNRMAPQAPASTNDAAPAGQRRYWGWNEIPLARSIADDPLNWDAVVIKMPPAVCGGSGDGDNMDCLSATAQEKLETLLDWYVTHYLKAGASHITTRPGSYIVLMKEWNVGGKSWERGFFCGAWSSPNNKYKVVYIPISKTDTTGVCYLDYGSGSQSLPESKSDVQQVIHV
jgi:hypothetical protein